MGMHGFMRIDTGDRVIRSLAIGDALEELGYSLRSPQLTRDEWAVILDRADELPGRKGLDTPKTLDAAREALTSGWPVVVQHERVISLPSEVKLWQQLEVPQARAKVRTLDRVDARNFLVAVRRVRRYTLRHNLDPYTVEVRVDGGAVSNSYYRHTGMCSVLVLRDNILVVGRGEARSVPYGDTGGLRYARVRDPGHKSNGRCKQHGGYAYPLERAHG